MSEREKHVSELIKSRAIWYELRADELRALAKEVKGLPVGSPAEEAIWQLLIRNRPK